MPKILPNKRLSWLITKKGFTLVELLIVMSIIGVLATIVIGSFASSQMRGRDAQRKNDLKQISNALELYYNDHGKYPDTLPAWGSEFTDGKTTYFKTLPADPSNGYYYFYRLVDSPANQKYQIYARIENTQDKQLIVTSYQCGPKNCNFALTSANTKPNE